MKHFLRIIIGLSIILLVLSVTALSCNKTAGDKSNSNNNSSGDNTPKPSTPTIVITNPVDGSAKLTTKTNDGGKEYDTILINSGKLEGPYGVDLATGLDEIIFPSFGNTGGNLFDLTITGGVVGNTAATGGLVLVSTGDLASFTNFTTPKVGDLPTYNSGIYIPNANATANADEYKPAGFKFWGAFGDIGAPKDNNPGTAPFAFTFNKTSSTGIDTQPILSCRSVISTITTSAADGANNTNPATPDKLLTGGQTSKCFMLPRRRFANVGEINGWFTASYVDPTKWKTSFYIAVAGIRTDKKEFKEVLTNFTDANDDARLAAFMDGLTTAEMEQLARDNIYAYKKILVKIVTPTEFANAPDASGTVPTLPTATVNIDGFDAGVRLDGDTIQIRTSAFPAIAAGNGAATLDDLASAPTGSLTKAFDIKITGGDRDPANPTTPSGGLVMVGTGDKTAIGDFGTTKQSFTAVATSFEEGHTTGAPTNAAATATEYQQAGWNIYGAFMDDAVPKSQSATDTPFAFSETTTSNPSQPFLFCRSTATKLTDPSNADYHTNDLAGGETATCYIGSKGTALNDATNPQATHWLNNTSANFKKTFKISIGAIRTDTDPVNQIITGTTLAQRDRNFQDGLSKAELENIITRYPSDFKTVSVTITNW